MQTVVLQDFDVQSVVHGRAFWAHLLVGPSACVTVESATQPTQYLLVVWECSRAHVCTQDMYLSAVGSGSLPPGHSGAAWVSESGYRPKIVFVMPSKLNPNHYHHHQRPPCSALSCSFRPPHPRPFASVSDHSTAAPQHPSAASPHPPP